jgi:peptidoglycan hydrolase-like protein with peptidoglycan-binding domain
VLENNIMSNLLKSKFLLGVMVVAIMVVGFAVASTASAADCTMSGATLRVGASGADVICLQSKIGATADGKFGPMTKAAVMAFQASNGLVADGVVGTLTRTALMNIQLAGTTFPAGCTSTTGFSTTTGQSCAVVSTLPAGCTSTVGFSPTTGAKCDGGTSPVGPLTGDVGSVDISSTSTDVEDVAIEGQATKMLGFKVEASDSDVSITNLKVTLENTDAPASPYRLTNYVDSVDIYMGSTKVGSADVSDFSKSGYVYTETISLSNAIVKMGSSNKATFYVVINAASSIDTSNMVGGAQPARLNITVTNLRFLDGSGAIMTEGTVGSITAPATGSFDSLASAGDLKLYISKGSMPVEGTVTVSNTGSTSNIKLNEFKLKATGDDLSFGQLTFAVDAVMGTNANPVTNMISDLELKQGTNSLSGTYTFCTGVFPACTGGDIYDETTDTVSQITGVKFVLDDTYTISQDSTDTFGVYAKIADISDFTSGSLKVSLPVTGIDTENSNGDTGIAESGSATGAIQTFTADAAVVGNYSWAVNTSGTMLDFFFTVDNSEGDTAFDVVTADVNDTLGSGSTGIIRIDSNVYETDLQGVVTWYSGDTVTPTASTKYTVASGDSATFRIRYSLGDTNATAITNASNGEWVEVVQSTIAGQTVPSAKAHSPAATVSL